MSEAVNKKRPTVAVVMEGGLVQCLVSDQPEAVDCDFLIIDYDTEGSIADEIDNVEQRDGNLSEAIVRVETVDEAEIGLAALQKSRRK